MSFIQSWNIYYSLSQLIYQRAIKLQLNGNRFHSILITFFIKLLQERVDQNKEFEVKFGDKTIYCEGIFDEN